MKVGDEVLYVPDACYALIPNSENRPDIGIRQGEYPWVVGRKDRNGEVVEIPAGELRETLRQLKKNRTGLSRVGLELIRPNVSWPAVVVGIDGDWVDLDIDHPATCVTLHSRVKVDPEGKTPNTCHSAKVEAAAPTLASVPAPVAVRKTGPTPLPPQS